MFTQTSTPERDQHREKAPLWLNVLHGLSMGLALLAALMALGFTPGAWGENYFGVLLMAGMVFLGACLLEGVVAALGWVRGRLFTRGRGATVGSARSPEPRLPTVREKEAEAWPILGHQEPAGDVTSGSRRIVIRASDLEDAPPLLSELIRRRAADHP